MEGDETARADLVQGIAPGFVLRHFPWLVRVEILVDLVGIGHGQPGDGGEFALLVRFGDGVGQLCRACTLRLVFHVGGRQQAAVELAGDEACGAAGDVDVFADQVGIDAGEEIVRVEIDVLHARIELGGEVVAQPLGVHADIEIAQRRDAGAAALAHLGAADRDEAVHVHPVGCLATGEMQHRRPEEHVEIDDVLADEVHLFRGRVGKKRLEIQAALRAQGLERGEIADRRIEPDIEILARRIGNLDAEIRRVARDVPVGEAACRGFAAVVCAVCVRAGVAAGTGAVGTDVVHVAEPFARLGDDFGLQARLAPAIALARPLAQVLHAARVGQAEEVMLGDAPLGRGAGQRRVRILQLGCFVDGAAMFAGVAVLIRRAAARALALDVAIRQEHCLDRVVELLDRAHVDQAGVTQAAVDRLRQLDVLGRVGAVPVVETDVKAVQIRLSSAGNARDEGLRRDAFLLGGDHDRRAVRIVGADEVDGVPAHALETHPDVGLDVFHDVADMERTVRIRQRGRHEQGACFHWRDLSKANALVRCRDDLRSAGAAC